MIERGLMIATLIIALSVSFATGCNDAPSTPPRLVLLYAPCSVSKYFLSPWNEKITFTPKLASFAERSLVFERHQTETGQSGISYASLFTGTQADQHRVYRHPTTLDDDTYLITEAYAEAGYETFYWNGHSLASGKLKYAQGVDERNLFGVGLKADDDRFAAILDKLARDPDYKAFIVTNFIVTHGPYSKEFVGRFMREYPEAALGVTTTDIRRYADLYRGNHLALTWNHQATLERLGVTADLPRFARVIELLYRANINELDRLFGEVVDAIEAKGLFDESLIVFTADHGEVMNRESATFKWTHSMLLDHEVIGVPLIVHAPNIDSANLRYTNVTRSTDVFPTMAGLSGVPIATAHAVAGQDLSPVLRARRAPPRLLAFSHSTVLVKMVFEQMYQEQHADKWREARRLFPDESVEHIWVAVRDGDEWFKHRKLPDGDWETQAFDLARDPDANRNIFDPTDEHHVDMRDALLEYKALLVRNYNREGATAPAGSAGETAAETVLRRLGYIE